MKIGRWGLLALAGSLLLTGCSGFWDKPIPPTPPTTKTSGAFYVLNFATSQIAGYYVNAGVLTALPGSPYALSSPPISIAIAPNNQFLYVSTVSGIYLYTIASNGQLTLSNNAQVISADGAASMQVDATNSWLIEAVTGVPTAFAIHINSTNGLLLSTIQQAATLPNSTIQQIAMSPDNTYVFIAMGAGGTATIPFNPNNANPLGRVSTIPVKTAGGGALSVAVDPTTATTTTPRLLYIGETAALSGANTGGLRVFNFSGFQEISGSPFAIDGLAPVSILPFSTGEFVYVLNRQVSGSTTGIVKGFSIASVNDALTLTPLASTFSAGTLSRAIVEDNSGAFVFAVNFGGTPDLKGYTIDATTAGALDPVISAATGTDPVQAVSIAAVH